MVTGAPAMKEIDVLVEPFGLRGDLRWPDGAEALAVFAHGSGSSRLSPRNRQVAEALNARGMATFLFDLLDPEEELDRANVFDIGLLAGRLVAAVDWLDREEGTSRLHLGLFGASTGAAAALVAAAHLGPRVEAVVSRGGRPDLATDALPRVRAATLLIVGGADTPVIAMNEEAFGLLHEPKALKIIPGATHLFSEPGALEQVIDRAGEWFERHLTARHTQDTRSDFKDRSEAGRILARKLARYKAEDPIILALPRGGVAVAAGIALALDAPLDLVLVRKLGVPSQPELAMGAVVDGPRPYVVRNEDILAQLQLPEEEFRRICERELGEIDRRRQIYLRGRPSADIEGRAVIVVDDGIATGATTRAALRAVRSRRPGWLVLAVPVAPPSTLDELRDEVDEIVCLKSFEPFFAIGAFYEDFRQVTDSEVIEILSQVRAPAPSQREPMKENKKELRPHA